MAAASTFAYDLKEALTELPIRGNCCRRALLGGLLLYRQPTYFAPVTSLTERLQREFQKEMEQAQPLPAGEYTESDIFQAYLQTLFHCENCPRLFMRGLFLALGSITDPRRAYHLELNLPDSTCITEVTALLTQAGLPPHSALRRGMPVLYYKESEAIEDFLNYIGAQQAAFHMMNIRIERDLRNTANRQANCDTANIEKAIRASGHQLSAIEQLLKSGRFQQLPEELQQTARLRRAHPDATLEELAKMHEPPITKSGANHRLQKLIALGEAKEETCGSDLPQ